MADKARPAELTAFLRALELSSEFALELGGNGIDADDIAPVESAWQIPDTVVSSTRPTRPWRTIPACSGTDPTSSIGTSASRRRP